MEQRIGILGGTFNPIHNAHLKMALDFSETLHFDKVLIIPTRIPPHKRAADMASTEDRLEMCRLAARSSPVFQVSDLEIRRPGPYGNPQTDPLWGADRSFCAQAGGGLYPGTPPVSIKMGEVFPCPYQR